MALLKYCVVRDLIFRSESRRYSRQSSLFCLLLLYSGRSEMCNEFLAPLSLIENKV